MDNIMIDVCKYLFFTLFFIFMVGNILFSCGFLLDYFGNPFSWVWSKIMSFFNFLTSHLRSQYSTINTVLSKSGNDIFCHTVGINGCNKIISIQLPINNGLPCYKYIAKYDDNYEEHIENVLLATDVRLS